MLHTIILWQRIAIEMPLPSGNLHSSDQTLPYDVSSGDMGKEINQGNGTQNWQGWAAWRGLSEVVLFNRVTCRMRGRTLPGGGMAREKAPRLGRLQLGRVWGTKRCALNEAVK